MDSEHCFGFDSEKSRGVAMFRKTNPIELRV